MNTSNLARTALLVVALAVGWAAYGAIAQQDDDVSAFRDQKQTGLIPSFPFRDCVTKAGTYRLAPEIKSLGGGKYCFTIRVDQQGQNCSSSCCTADLAKIEFNVSGSCLVQPAAVVPATINGKPTRVRPAFDRPVKARPGAAILRLTQLGLNTSTARDAEVCITIKPNSHGQGCTTIEQLCATETGAPAGTCAVAMYDTACDCCPVSHTSTPTPPPPSPSPSDFPFGKRFCEVCISSMLRLPTVVDPWPYRYNSAACASIQQQIAASMNTVIVQNNVTMVSYFAANSTYCTDSVVGTCGQFNATAEQLVLINSTVQSLVPQWVDLSSGGNICRPEFEHYVVDVTTVLNPCISVAQSATCTPPPQPPFPDCTCNTSQYILPYTISPRYFPLPSSNKSTTTEYCFPISTLPRSQVLKSTCSTGNDVLSKIAWYAHQNMSSMVRGFNLYPAVGNVSRLSTSWGAPGTSILKATGINWNTTQANGGMVCVELRNPAKMENLCIGASAAGQQLCHVSVFNSNQNCCPIYRSSLLPSSA